MKLRLFCEESRRGLRVERIGGAGYINGGGCEVEVGPNMSRKWMVSKLSKWGRTRTSTIGGKFTYLPTIHNLVGKLLNLYNYLKSNVMDDTLIFHSTI